MYLNSVPQQVTEDAANPEFVWVIMFLLSWMSQSSGQDNKKIKRHTMLCTGRLDTVKMLILPKNDIFMSVLPVKITARPLKM